MHRKIALMIVVIMALALPAPLSAASCSPIVLSAAAIHEETLGFDVDLEYPVMCAPNANRIIRDWVQFRLFDFKKFDPGHDLTDFPHKYEMQMRYEVWPSHEERYASVKISVAVYTGGAHYNHWAQTWLFDLKEDRPLSLDELFIDLEAGLERVSRLVRIPLRQSLGNMYVEEMVEQGLEPLERNFRTFIFTDEGVAFFFIPYQVAPFAAGEQVVTIPYSSLDGILSPEIAQRVNLH